MNYRNRTTYEEQQKDELFTRLSLLLLKNDMNQIQYFDKMLLLQSGKSISEFSSNEELLNFILQLFYQSNDLHLTYQSLCIINKLFIIPEINIIFIGCDDFYKRCISLITNKNEELRYLALNTIVNYIQFNKACFKKVVEFGFLESIISIIEEHNIEENTINLTQIFYSLWKLEPLLFTIQQKELFWNISFLLISNNINSGKYIKPGFIVMQNLISHSFQPVITEEFYQMILKLYNSPGEVLDSLFSLITLNKFPNKEDTYEYLIKNNFFMNLFERTKEEYDIGNYLYKFLDTISYIPEETDPIINNIFYSLMYSNYQTKISCLKYVHSILLENSNFSLIFSENGIIETLNTIIEANDTNFISEAFNMLLRIFPTISSQRNILSFKGAEKLQTTLIELSDTSEFENIIDSLLSYYQS